VWRYSNGLALVGEVELEQELRFVVRPLDRAEGGHLANDAHLPSERKNMRSTGQVVSSIKELKVVPAYLLLLLPLCRRLSRLVVEQLFCEPLRVV
jgi:hypothetical protein